MIRRSMLFAGLVLVLLAAEGCRYPYYRYPVQRYPVRQYSTYSHYPATTTNVVYACPHGYTDSLACPYCNRYYRTVHVAPSRPSYPYTYDRRYYPPRDSRHPRTVYANDHPKTMATTRRPGSKPAGKHVITIPAPPIIVPPLFKPPDRKK